MEAQEKTYTLVPVAVLGILFTLISGFLLLGMTADAEAQQDTVVQVG